jgi:hypothetical protein
MMPRTDTITAMRVELIRFWYRRPPRLEASCMLAVSSVPAKIAARVLAEPERWRRLDPAPVER